MRLASAVTCCLSVDTLQEYSPECSTVVSLRVNSVTYTEAPAPDPCFSTNPPLPVTGLPLCIHWTESRLVVTGSEVSTSQVSTETTVQEQHSLVWQISHFGDFLCGFKVNFIYKHLSYSKIADFDWYPIQSLSVSVSSNASTVLDISGYNSFTVQCGGTFSPSNNQENHFHSC